MENLYSTEPGLRTPVYVVDEAALIHNLEVLQGVQQRKVGGQAVLGRQTK